jgi:ribosomal protein S18 acetylase RimI-like enzyme
MTFQLSRMTASDLEQWTIREFSAPVPRRLSVFWTAELSSSSVLTIIDQRCHTLTSDPAVHYLKIMDTKTGEMIATAKWSVCRGCGEERFETDNQTYHLIPEQKTSAMAKILGLLREQRRLCLGMRPHMHLSDLATRLAHRRRGAGSMLIRWGLEKANEKGMEAYLEASEQTRLLYEKFGFKVAEQFKFDKVQYGGEGEEQYLVRRPIFS